MKRQDLTGQRFGRLTVIAIHGKDKRGKLLWLCRCDCGNTSTVRPYNLKNGNTKSCGCFQKEVSGNLKHGLLKAANRQETHRLHYIWASMKTRCNNSNRKGYKDYGERGIKVCKEWNDDFKAFYDWALSHGYADNLTIDRIDVNGNYEPSNCRWITNIEQQKNKRNSKKI